MTIEGQVTIHLRRGEDGPARARITSSRPTGLARSFAGRSVGRVVHDLPLLFSVCGIAQASASLAAFAQAIDLREPPATQRARQLLVMAETLREHLLRIVHGSSCLADTKAEKPDMTPIMRIVPEFREALAPDDDLFALGAAPRINAGKVADRIAAAEDLLRDLVFGEAPSDWLTREEPAAFERWAGEGKTAAARLIARVLREGWTGSGAQEAAFLPELPQAPLFKRLTGSEGESFAARPDWHGKACETTALSRQRTQPLPASLLAAYGSALLPRLAARLVEIARLPGQMRELLEQGETVGSLEFRRDMPLGHGRGLAQIEAARGRLIHGVAVEGETVRDYRILAPTEWNFHPQGSVRRALAGLIAGDEHSLRSQATLLIETVDPCVACRLVLH